MITAKELRTAITSLLKANFSTYEVHFDDVEQAKASYFYVELAPSRRTVDDVYYDRSIGIDLQLVLLPDCRGRVKRSLLYDAIDTLDMAMRPVLQVKDRFITIMGTSSVIVDEVLHYEFSLDFADFMPVERGELMQELYLNGFTELDEEE